MALPVSNAAENEDELVHGFDATGYSQLPADHLSDSSDSSNGTSGNLAYDTLGMSETSLQMENLATTRNGDAIAHFHESTPHHNGAYIAHINGMEIQAATQNEDVVAYINAGTQYHNGAYVAHINGTEIQAATQNEDVVAYINAGTPYQNGGHVAHIDGMENRTETAYQNDNHVAHVDGMELQGTASNINALNGNGGHVVHIDGMEIHVYGQLAGLQLSSQRHNNVSNPDDEEDVGDEDDVDDSERQHSEDAAFQRAKEADEARRLAPLPPEQCQAIKNAMQSISLGGFRPEWADRVPEEEWVNRLRRKSVSKSVEN